MPVACQRTRRTLSVKPEGPHENFIDAICRTNKLYTADSGTSQAAAKVLPDTATSQVPASSATVKTLLKSISNHLRLQSKESKTLYNNYVYHVVTDCVDFATGRSNNSKLRPDPSLACSALLAGAKTCVDNQLPEHKTIKELILALYHYYGGFDVFFSFLDPLTSPFEEEHALYPKRDQSVDFTLMDRYLDTLEYFIRVAKGIWVEVLFEETRASKSSLKYWQTLSFVNAPLKQCRGSTPLMLACQSVNKRAVRLLLQHGARPLACGLAQYDARSNTHYPLFSVTCSLNSSVFWELHAADVDRAQLTTFLMRIKRQQDTLLDILRLFSRAVVRLPVYITSAVSLLSDPDDTELLFKVHKKFRHHIDVTSVPTLRQMCRIALRISLGSRDQLPQGVAELPLPRIIQQYINMEVEI